MIIDQEYEYKEGQHYNESDFNIIIENTEKVYLQNKKNLLFSFHKNVLNNEVYFPLLEKNYHNCNYHILTSAKRKIATGEKLQEKRTPSGIIGFIDTITPQHKKLLKGISNGARKTKFLAKKEKQWKETLPLYKDIDQIFKKALPKYYLNQRKEYDKIIPELKIAKTNFTTITVNRNWRTATHTDKGDLISGLSCIACIGNNKYKGGYLGFPKQKILVKMEPGDVIFMNSHQPHCNTSLHVGKQGVRYSLVCYIRENMKLYQYPVEVKNQHFFLSKEDFNRFNKT